MGAISTTLVVRNAKETIELYRNTLGFKEGIALSKSNNPEYANLLKDGMVLMFLSAKNLGIGSEEKLGTSVNLYMEIDRDIDKYYQGLKKRGGLRLRLRKKTSRTVSGI
jgi:uncharacterized glyoxalase superfamily protein PhnB